MRTGLSRGKFLYHTSCIKCTSSDGMAVYENRDSSHTAYCYACETYFNKDELKNNNNMTEVVKEKEQTYLSVEDINNLKSGKIPDRKLSEEIVSMYGIKLEYDEQTGEIKYHYYPFYNDHGQLTGYKRRTVSTKDFTVIGNIRGAKLFGSQAFNDNGEMLIITEGELDTASAYQMLKAKGKNYRVVSLVNGASVKAIKDNLEYIERFSTIILCFDQDDPGQRAAQAAAEILSPGKAKIMSFSEKDPSDMLTAGKTNEFFSAIFNAKEYHPDGICDLADCYEDMWKLDSMKGIEWPYEGLNDQLYEIFPGHLYTITSAPGSGKTTLVQELEYFLLNHTEDNIGILHLEQNPGQTSWKLVARHAQKPVHIRKKRQELGITREQVDKWWNETVGHRRIKVFNHFGSTQSDNILTRVRYLIKALDCKYIFLDHLSIIVSDQEEGDERKTIDRIMTKLRQIVEETGVTMFLVVHLRRADGDKGHEHGKEVTLNHLRGSQSIAQLSDVVMATERDQQSPDPKIRNISLLRILKDRDDGNTGPCCYLLYHKDTTIMTEVPISKYDNYLAQDLEF